MNALLLPRHSPDCVWCQGVQIHLHKRQHNYRALLKLLAVTALLLAGWWAAR